MSALTDIPIAIGNALGISNASDALFVGGMILSAVVMLSVVLAMSFAARGKSKNAFSEIIVMFTVMGIVTIVGWLPGWILVVGLVALVALFSGKIMDYLGK